MNYILTSDETRLLDTLKLALVAGGVSKGRLETENDLESLIKIATQLMRLNLNTIRLQRATISELQERIEILSQGDLFDNV